MDSAASGIEPWHCDEIIHTLVDNGSFRTVGNIAQDIRRHEPIPDDAILASLGRLGWLGLTVDVLRNVSRNTEFTDINVTYAATLAGNAFVRGAWTLDPNNVRKRSLEQAISEHHVAILKQAGELGERGGSHNWYVNTVGSLLGIDSCVVTTALRMLQSEGVMRSSHEAIERPVLELEVWHITSFGERALAMKDWRLGVPIAAPGPMTVDDIRATFRPQ